MSRFLFVVPPLTGHVNPTLALAEELTRRGHEVAWCGVPGGVDPLLAPGARFLPACSLDQSRALATVTERPDDLRGAAALRFLWRSVLLPLTEAMVDGVDRAVATFGPDVLVVDQQALAGGIVAQRRGIAWATSATTSGESSIRWRAYRSWPTRSAPGSPSSRSTTGSPQTRRRRSTSGSRHTWCSLTPRPHSSASVRSRLGALRRTVAAPRPGP